MASEYEQFVRDNPFFEGRDFSSLTAQERQLARKIVEKEYFARRFEAYLMEGKAPSAEIQGAFSRFRKWLMAVYRHIRNLRVELNDEVREVFGCMIAAEHETGMAAAEYGLLGLTLDEMKALGMTRSQQDYARKLTEAALDVAATRLARARNRERHRRKKEYQETATEELAMKPVYMARDAMLETPLDADLWPPCMVKAPWKRCRKRTGAASRPEQALTLKSLPPARALSPGPK